MPLPPDDSAGAFWERNAPRYDVTMRLLGRPIPRALQLVGEAVAGAGRVLEVAAGTGIFTRAIARSAREVVATDYAAAMVRALDARVRAEGLDNVRCERADLYRLPFPRASFDAVVAANVLHLVPDLPAALAALSAVLRPGGRLVAPTFLHSQTVVAAIASRAFGLIGFPGHRRFSSRSLRQAVESAGFRVVRAETIPGLLPVGYVEAESEPEPDPVPARPGPAHSVPGTTRGSLA